ncbi:MAG: threonine/serine ThrE exporter family protein [Actinomycetota bacterium]
MDGWGRVSRLAEKRMRARQRSRLTTAAADAVRTVRAERPVALDLAAEAGSLLLSNGAAAAEIVDTVMDILKAADLPDVNVVVTYDQVTLSIQPEDGGEAYARIAAVRSRAYNFGRYATTVAVVRRHLRGEVTARQALDEIRELRSARLQPRWLTRVAAGVTGLSAGLVFEASPYVAVLAFVAVLFSDWLGDVLASRRWPGFFVQMVVGAIAVVVAVIGLRIDPEVDVSAVIVAVIIVALAGMTVTGAVQDAITGWYLTGSVRVFEALIKSLGLVVGIKAAVMVADRMGVEGLVLYEFGEQRLDPTVMVFLAGLLVLAFSLTTQMPWRGVLTSAGIGMGGYIAYGAMSGTGVWASAVAALVVGILAAAVARWVRIPVSALTNSAVLPLLPGVALFEGLITTTDYVISGITGLATAMTIALTLAVGMTLGGHLVAVGTRPWRDSDDRLYVPYFSEPVATLKERDALELGRRTFRSRAEKEEQEAEKEARR